MMQHFLLLALSLSCLHIAHGLVPAGCVLNATKPDGMCCPTHPTNGLQCGGPKRGVCAPLRFHKEKVPDIYIEDDRVHFPLKFYTHFCHCEPNFFGPACEECWYNRKGYNCDQVKVVVRRNLATFTDREKKVFKAVMDQSYYEDSGYYSLIEDENKWSDPMVQPQFIRSNVHYYMSTVHRFASRSTLFEDKKECEEYGILDFNHDASGFCSWHRYLDLVWERFFQKIAKRLFGIKDWALPYWDWMNKRKCDICTNDLVGAEGKEDTYGFRISKDSPFYKWTEYCTEPTGGSETTCFGCHKNPKFGKITRHFRSVDFPTFEHLKFVLSKDKFYVKGDREANKKDRFKCESAQLAIEGFCGPRGSNRTLLWTHNKIHNMIDGSMCCSATANSDPLFVLHHITIDRLLASWQKKYGLKASDMPNEGVKLGHCGRCPMTGWIPVVLHKEMLTETEHLGYIYDTYITDDGIKDLYGVSDGRQNRDHGHNDWRK